MIATSTKQILIDTVLSTNFEFKNFLNKIEFLLGDKDLVWYKESWFITLAGAFLGAFFVFVFFIIGEKWKDKKERAKKASNEHVYLERYLDDIHIVINENIVTYDYIKSYFETKRTAFTALKHLPIRKEATINLKDLPFINMIHVLMSRIETLNHDSDKFNDLALIINNMVKEYTKDYIIKIGDKDEKKRYEIFISSNANNFIKDSEALVNGMKLIEKKIEEAMATNRFFIRINRNWFKKIIFSIRCIFNKKQREIEINKEKDELDEDLKRSYEENKKEMQEAGIIPLTK